MRYYENVTKFMKNNMKMLATTGMLMVAFVSLLVISSFGAENSAKELPKTTTEETEVTSETSTEVGAQKVTEVITEKITAVVEQRTTEIVKESKIYNSVNEKVYVIYNVNVRDAAEGKKVGYLYAGDEVKRTAIGTNGWSEIEFEGKKAYIFSEYVTNNKAVGSKGISKAEVKSANVSTASGYVKNNVGLTISEEDYYWLIKIVHAEAGNQDEKGRILVANAIINRVKSNEFPDNIKDVIFQVSGGIYQFSPVKNGYISTVNADQTTINCVNRALNGECYSNEVLYFSSQKSPYSWHNTNLAYLFTYGDHAFYK
ncbi:MAG: cell wall hydrolase [Lachnospiraceae bacterium]|nr:cell wall hydrolase [Lachnospiraceae bacterium]